MTVARVRNRLTVSTARACGGSGFGEMWTLMNYTFQSFNFRGRAEYRPYYDLVANIAAREFAHIELVGYRFSPDDYWRVGEVWTGEHPEDGQELTVEDSPPKGATPPDLHAGHSSRPRPGRTCWRSTQ